MELKEGLERWIFQDYQREQKVIGKVKLLEFNREGLSFILEDMPKDRQIVYSIQYWKCEILSDGGYYPKGYVKTFPIRYIMHTGQITSNDKEDNDDEISEEEYLEKQIILDKFIIVDGTEAF